MEHFLSGDRGRAARRRAGGIVVAALIGSLGVSASSATPPGTNGLLLFQKQIGPVSQLFTMNPDGTGLRQITRSRRASFEAAWSPDASRIAFERQFGNRTAILVMRADGSALHDLTPSGVQDHPSFTPDGRSLVYVRSLLTDQSVWVMSVNGQHRRRLTRGIGDEQPAVSPDGSSVAFIRNSGVFVVAVDGTSPHRITPVGLGAGDGRLDWSPDGSRILFGAGGQVYTVGPDGSHLRHIATGGHNLCPESFSPDGTRIFLLGNCDSPTQSRLYVMSAGGGRPDAVPNGLGVHRLTQGIGS